MIPLPAPTPTRRRARALTVLELLLALSLGTLIVAGATALLATLVASERFTGESFDATVDRSVARTVLERSFGSLVAAPIPTSRRDVVRSTTETPTDEEGNPLFDPEIAALLQGPPEEQEEEPVGPDRFELRWELITPTIEAQVLDITLQRSPIETRPLPDEQSLTASLFASAATDDEWLRIMALRRSGRTLETVKGLIEPVLLSDGWALQWRQTDPPAEPFVLIRRILAYEWSVLPVSIETREWLDIIRAGYDEQFPMAVRLVAETQDGPPIDWMFECIVTVSLNEEWR